MDHKTFVSAKKSILIAPAGYGKTHAIVECLNHTSGRQLILTHTHAGIASIKEKIKLAKVPSDKFHVETITGYAEKYVNAFSTGLKIPVRDETDAYYTFLIVTATSLLKRPIIHKILSVSYTGIFVDEYQDCTKSQHDFICTLSDVLPTHIFGDPLQGIFGFKGTDMVKLDDDGHMEEFMEHRQMLEIPWRWKDKNEKLGIDLKEIRLRLEAKQPIDLRQYKAIETLSIFDPAHLYNPKESYYKSVSKLLTEKNILLIHPLSSNVNVRLKILSKFSTPITLIESIDDKDFYSIAKLLDDSTIDTIVPSLVVIFLKLLNKTGVRELFNDNGVINKRNEPQKTVCETIKTMLSEIKTTYTPAKIAMFIRYIAGLKNIRCYRKELLNAVCQSLDDSHANGKTVCESMFLRRGQSRRMGRKVYGRSIGTTLLTKGLEFDTVIVLNAHDFSCPKNLYVALTRASKRLIVFTNNPVLSPQY